MRHARVPVRSVSDPNERSSRPASKPIWTTAASMKDNRRLQNVRLVTYLIATGTAAWVVAVAAPAPAGARVVDTGCAHPYAYAGKAGGLAASGVVATITALGPPSVPGGHIAAWVGVGGRGLGPRRTDAWIQVGLSGRPGGIRHVYYELALPGRAPAYVVVEPNVADGASHRVAVVAERRERWSVWVDGRRRAGPFRLQGSAAWRPVATAETWDGGSTGCNRFRYRFADVATRSATGRWAPLVTGAAIVSRGYAIDRRRAASFVASATF